VRRPARATSTTTKAFLEHLERAGFDGAPRHLGRDAEDREVLSFVEGDVPIAPPPAWALTDEALVSVGDLLRRFHAASATFDPAGHRWPRAVPAPFGGGLVCHNDPNLDNVVFAGGRAVALIDFDLAGPGSPAWEVACAARHWVPLCEDGDMPEALRGQALDRLRTFADAYGLAAADRALVPAAARAAHRWSYAIVREAVARGHTAFRRRWDEDGGRARAARTDAWLVAHASAMARALARAA
jgi:Ser/Thr protein kinase RdoA (MazF antagonist)